MTDQSSPKGVNLLKELLFDRETKRLDDLGRRIEAEAEAANVRNKTLNERLDAVFERAGTEERLQHSVAGIIDGALREAEVVKHEPLSRAIAPLVIRTIKYQLKESQEEMVEALYPITGRLVKSYVQAEVSKMMAEINAKLGGGRPAQLQAQSDATGVSVDKLALAEANKLEVEELFLVRRGSGDLVAHWERPELATGPDEVQRSGAQPGGDNRDALISGYIEGIMSFSEDAFGAKAGSFRALALENGDKIFVRGSAAHLLAVRCKGSAAPAVENVIDEVFLQTIERYHQVLADDAKRMRTAGGPARDEQAQTRAEVQNILPKIGTTIEAMTAERQAALIEQQSRELAAAKPSFTRLYVMASLLATPLLLWAGWSAYQTWQTTSTENAARRILSSTEEIAGVPPRVDVERGGRALTISGFVPNTVLREQILMRFKQEIPQAKVRDQLGVLPAGAGPSEIVIADLQRQIELQRTELETSSLARPIERARFRIGQVRADLKRLPVQSDLPERGALDEFGRMLAAAAGDTDSAYAIVEDGSRIRLGLSQPLNGAWQKLRAAEGQLTGLLRGPLSVETGKAAERAPGNLVPLAEEVAMAAERISAGHAALMQTLALRPVPQQIGGISEKVAVLNERIERLKGPTAREELESFVRAKAIFFENGNDLRDTALAGTIVEQLARRLRDNPEIVMRVVGYTDERGSQLLNSNLAQTRADRIAALLVDRGVPANRLVAVGRLTGKDLARGAGPGSANRRVEFEIGFPGEAGGAQ